ncbi:hypothetical protein P2117_004800 [Klebsiella michiganensis]|nr:hypothetical protein [Klebsiella michiganensis]
MMLATLLDVDYRHEYDLIVDHVVVSGLGRNHCPQPQLWQVETSTSGPYKVDEMVCLVAYSADDELVSLFDEENEYYSISPSEFWGELGRVILPRCHVKSERDVTFKPGMSVDDILAAMMTGR